MHAVIQVVSTHQVLVKILVVYREQMTYRRWKEEEVRVCSVRCTGRCMLIVLLYCTSAFIINLRAVAAVAVAAVAGWWLQSKFIFNESNLVALPFASSSLSTHRGGW